MRSMLGPIVAAVVVLAAALPPAPPSSGEGALRGAVRDYLAALRPASRARATFAFSDPARGDWHFVPRERRGLALGAMDDAERRATHALLRAALTPRGYGRALGVIELESVLREIESNPGRDPGLYHVSVFGEPAGAGPWSLRFEGHHLALNFTGVSRGGIAPTPLFLGSNPGEVLDGPRAGFKLLAPHEERARELVRSLSPPQRRKAVISETAPADVLFGPGRAVEPPEREGIAFAELDPEQLALARALVAEFEGDVAGGGRAAGEVPSASELASTRFAWAGGLEPGQGHYWRIAGPRDVFEYDNTQNGANHVHALWRDRANDLAAAWLARHHAAEH